MKYKGSIVLMALLVGMSGCSHDKQPQASNEAPLEVARDDLKDQAKGYRLLMDDSNVVLLENGYSIFEISHEDKVLWARKDNVLYESTDKGQTFDELYTFDRDTIDTIDLTKGGSLLVSVSNGRFTEDANNVIYRSMDMGKSFEPVLELPSGSAYHWSIASSDNDHVYISEYGYKKLPDNARRIFKSTDDGKSWLQVFDNGEHDNNHFHRIHVDSDAPNTIYQAVGDGDNNTLLVSKDYGETWSSLVEAFNPTGVAESGNYLVWGTDTHPGHGIYVMDKTSHEIVSSFVLPLEFAGPIYDVLNMNGTLYAGVMSYDWESHVHDSTIWYSTDHGFTWDIFKRIEKIPAYGIGIYKLLYLEDDLYVRVSMAVENLDTQAYEKFSGTMKIRIED